MVLVGDHLEMYIFTKIRLWEKDQDMKVWGIRAFTSKNITDGFITQFKMGNNKLAWIVYRTTGDVEKTVMVLLTFSVYDE